MAVRLQGKISWFGGPNDSTDSGHTASGGTTREPGIAVFNHATLGGYWRVSMPNGRTAVVRQTDIGPAPWTGRKLDFTYSLLPHLGYSQRNFPTDAMASAEYLGKTAPRGEPVISGGAGIAGSASGPEESSGASAAAALLQQMMGAAKPSGPAISPLTAPAQSAAPPVPEGFHLPAQSSTSAPAQSADPSAIMAALASLSSGGPGGGSLLAGNTAGGPGGGAANVTQLHGLSHFTGKPVAGWIAPILQWAQQHGWKGTVTSGYRSRGEQERIYNSGVRPAAKPGTSNHEFTTYPGGAVDVTEAAQLAHILSQSPYRSVLVWAGAKDPAHFSHPHGGAY